MQDFSGPKSLTPAKPLPIVIVILAATIIGAPSGILIADWDSLPLLKKNIASQLAGVRSLLFASADTARAQTEAPDAIPTGLSPIVDIYHSPKLDSARMAFDLEAVDLVRTGKLSSPDRIYFDLQDRSREQGPLRRLKTQEAVRIAGDLLTGVRISQRKSGAVRIVLDLKRPCDFTYQTSPGPPSRLMVEIRRHRTGASASK